MKILKKNNSGLLEASGRTGFFGGVVAVYHNGGYAVIQNIKGHPKGSPILSFCNFDLTEDQITKIRCIYFDRYGVNLDKLLSLYNFTGSKLSGDYYERTFQQIKWQNEFSHKTFQKDSFGVRVNPTTARREMQNDKSSDIQYRMWS